MDRRLDWIVRKGALAAALYFALLAGVGWLQYAIAVVVWYPLAANLWAVPVGASWRAAERTAVPAAAAMAFDLAVLGALFLAHWYWTAFAYAISCGFAALMQGGATSKP